MGLKVAVHDGGFREAGSGEDAGDRFNQQPGEDPEPKVVDPGNGVATYLVSVRPTARVEAGATIGRGARVGAHVHLARDVTVGANGVVQDGTWIGTNTQLDPHAWVSHGTTIEPHCRIGHHATIGAGARIKQHAEIEPYSRLGAGKATSSSPTPRSNRGVHIANAVENIMRLDRE
jgi:carbonic anhydrase/acetyltransferase-like protein (isoleucine patch superfamily)